MKYDFDISKVKGYCTLKLFQDGMFSQTICFSSISCQTCNCFQMSHDGLINVNMCWGYLNLQDFFFAFTENKI